MKTLDLKPLLSKEEELALLAEPATEDHFDVVLRGEAEVWSGDHLLVKVVPEVLHYREIEAVRSTFRDFDLRGRLSLTRRAAAGKVSLDAFRAWRDDVVAIHPQTPTTARLELKDGRVLTQHWSVPTKSYIAGYGYDRFSKRARKAYVTNKFPELFEAALPFFHGVNRAFLQALPDAWKAHHQQCSRHPRWTIPGTVYSTAAINLDYSSCYHYDTGDLPVGYSSVSAMEVYGYYSGGMLVFPCLRVAVDLHDGDVCFFRAHELLHGNTRTEGPGRRLSVVTYLKRQLAEAVNCLEAP